MTREVEALNSDQRISEQPALSATVYRGFASPSHCLLDGSSDKRPIEETRKTRSRLVFDDEPVYAAIARGFKVAFMANIG